METSRARAGSIYQKRELYFPEHIRLFVAEISRFDIKSASAARIWGARRKVSTPNFLETLNAPCKSGSFNDEPCFDMFANQPQALSERRAPKSARLWSMEYTLPSRLDMPVCRPCGRPLWFASSGAPQNSA